MEKYRDEIENYVNCSHLARRDRDFGSIILMFRDEIEITYCYSHVLRREREIQIEFLKVERKNLSRKRIPVGLCFGHCRNQINFCVAALKAENRTRIQSTKYK